MAAPISRLSGQGDVLQTEEPGSSVWGMKRSIAGLKFWLDLRNTKPSMDGGGHHRTSMISVTTLVTWNPSLVNWQADRKGRARAPFA